MTLAICDVVDIGCVNYVAMGMADLGVFLPLYQGITSYPEAYTKGNGESSDDSAYPPRQR